jgi:hypothetical protein
MFAREYRGPEAADLRELTEIMRRLLVTYYEEARQYWPDARDAGLLQDENEVSAYMPSTSNRLIERYVRTAVSRGMIAPRAAGRV